MEVEGQWTFKAIYGELLTSNKVKTLSSILKYFDDTQANAVSEWLTSLPKDAILVLAPAPTNPLYKGGCFITWNAKDKSVSNKAQVKSGEFVYYSFIGLGKKMNLLITNRDYTILQRIDLVYCHQCLSDCGITRPRTLPGGIKITDGQTTGLNTHSATHTKKVSSANTSCSKTQYEQKVCFALAACNLPFHLVDREPFRNLLPVNICHRTTISTSVLTLLADSFRSVLTQTLTNSVRDTLVLIYGLQ